MTTNEKQFAFTACVGTFLVYAASMGYTITARDLKRARAWQRILYAIGRTTEPDRTPVTWTRIGYHTKALALDIIVFVNRKPVWDVNHPIYQDLGQFWEKLGGIWGGRWKGRKCDAPHFQWSIKMMEDT